MQRPELGSLFTDRCDAPGCGSKPLYVEQGGVPPASEAVLRFRHGGPRRTARGDVRNPPGCVTSTERCADHRHRAFFIPYRA